ncbi:hydroxymethylglutaryl-CoA lyase [Nakamurella leprariae]|uniref:Hydroxymethylglutaryl-CoA lyase n=1 Tax=Nakamurella leprariae TaxID=2803911 RepID=A0A939C015_9ACTN|nr:hydroxymethylglutaryl-CoA lyase [Nakamurella leprariae]MBM9468760.1 hydroxymethylglutaryl-CoA lyase [Nakamurella leprariae]
MSAASVQIVEVAPRDGLQNEARPLSTAAKLELIRRAVAAGARRVEITGFARPDVVPALADADEVAAATAALPGVQTSALVLNPRGYERARAAGVTAVNMVVLASETFSQRNQRMSVAQALDGAARIRERAGADGVHVAITVGASFGCPFEGEIPLPALRSVLQQVAAIGPDEISLADTIGVGTPADVRARFALLAELAPDVPRRAHFHDTRNTGVANAVAAVEAGVAALDASLGGIGGCPFAPAATGNVATEDLVYCFGRMGVDTGFELAPLLADARWLLDSLGRESGSALSRAGCFPESLLADPVRDSA